MGMFDGLVGAVGSIKDSIKSFKGSAVGEFLGFQGKTWAIEAQNASKTKFTGQFIAQNLEETSGSFLQDTNALNKAEPRIQWISGETTTLRFTGRIFATDSLENNKQSFNQLKGFIKRDKKLGRPPKLTLTIGTDLEYVCYLKGLRFKYDEIRNDGSIRGAVIEFEFEVLSENLDKVTPRSTATNIKFLAGLATTSLGIGSRLKGVINIPGGSLHTVGRTIIAKQGDTFESISAKEYGRALLGDILRRAQPNLANLVPGDEVTLVESAEIRNIEITPQSTALVRTQENAALLDLKLAARNRPTRIFV